MKSARLMLPLISLWLCAAGFAQSGTTTAASSEAQKSFNTLKTLAGSWDGVLSGAGPEFDGKIMHFTLRVTSTGNAMMHEMTGLPGRPDDPITMFYLDGDRLMLTHYCDAGNRPRMVAKTSPDAKTLDFEFLDVTGNMQYGHMHHVAFTVFDANHHAEEWTFMVGEKPVRAHFDLQRAK